MIDFLKTFFKNLFTESNNQTYSLARVSQAIGVVTCVGAAASLIWNKQVAPEFFEHFGGGLALIFGGGAINSKFMPEAEKGNDNG